MRRRLMTTLAALVAALASSVPAAHADGFGTPETEIVVEKIAPGVNEDPTGGGGGNGCYRAYFRKGESTTTGSYYWYFEPQWCGDGMKVTRIVSLYSYPYVSGWYSFDGDDGRRILGGCVGCASIDYESRGRFSWHPWLLPASHTTVSIKVRLHADGRVYGL